MALLLVGGCHRETPIERGIRVARQRKAQQAARVRLQTALFGQLSDAQGVRVNPRHGLGLALRAASTEPKVGEPLKLHMAWENLAAVEDISATTCRGFALSAEELMAGTTQTVPLSFSCPEEERLRDRARLPHGQLRTVEIDGAGVGLRFLHPGEYLVEASWQSFHATEAGGPAGSGYTLVRSNPLLITVR